jgi:hypothetical protein
MARLCDGDPPERFGAAYREQLTRPGAREVVGLAAERELLAGFLRTAATSERKLNATDLDAIWRQWLWQIATAIEPRARRRRRLSSFPDMASWYRYYGLEVALGRVAGYPMTAACEEVGIIEGWDPEADGERLAQAFSNHGLLDRAGATLYECLLDPAGSAQPTRLALRVLEDYAEPRSEQQLKQMV